MESITNNIILLLSIWFVGAVSIALFISITGRSVNWIKDYIKDRKDRQKC